MVLCLPVRSTSTQLLASTDHDADQLQGRRRAVTVGLQFGPSFFSHTSWMTLRLFPYHRAGLPGARRDIPTTPEERRYPPESWLVAAGHDMHSSRHVRALSSPSRGPRSSSSSPIGDAAMSRRSARGRKRRACKRQRPRGSLSVTAFRQDARHLTRAGRRAFLGGLADRRKRRSFHYLMRDARRSTATLAAAERAVLGPLATKPLLTIFGQKQDSFRYQKRWKALYPHAVEHVVASGHHFPMNDDPGLFADALRDFASDDPPRQLAIAQRGQYPPDTARSSTTNPARHKPPQPTTARAMRQPLSTRAATLPPMASCCLGSLMRIRIYAGRFPVIRWMRSALPVEKRARQITTTEWSSSVPSCWKLRLPPRRG